LPAAPAPATPINGTLSFEFYIISKMSLAALSSLFLPVLASALPPSFKASSDSVEEVSLIETLTTSSPLISS